MAIKAGFTHESTNNQTVEWYTPPWVFKALGVKFDLDPCHPAERLSWIPATTVYSLVDDGLKQEWKGNVWLNPPYGPHTKTWLAKLVEHKLGIALVFSRTDCGWFHDSINKADAILFLKGRIKFCDRSGNPKSGTPGSGSLLAAWGDENVEALRKMSKLGVLMEKVSGVWVRSK